MSTQNKFKIGGKCTVDVLPSLLPTHTDPAKVMTITNKAIVDSAKTGLGIWVDGIEGWIASCYVHPVAS